MAQFDPDVVDMSAGEAPQMRSRLHIQFFRKAIEDVQRSEAEGGPVWVDRVMIRKLVPGDPSSIIETIACVPENYPELKQLKRHPNADNNLYPREWQLFLARATPKHDGVPLAEFPALGDSQRKWLEFHEVHSVESLAEMADVDGQGLVGFQALKRKAGDFLKQRADSMHALALSAQVDTLEKTKAEQDRRLEEMAAKLAEMQSQLQKQQPAADSKQRK